MPELKVSIFFANEDEAQVLLQSDVAEEEEERWFETCFFSLFAARQIANLSRTPVMPSLQSVLAAIDTEHPLAWGRQALGSLELLPPSPVAAVDRGFRAEFRPEKRAFFKVKVVGFGLSATGTGYYAPMSVIALLVSLLERREDDGEYQRALAHTARLVGEAGTSGSLGVRSQAPIAMDSALGAWRTAFEEIDSELAGDEEFEDEEVNDKPIDSEVTAVADAETVHLVERATKQSVAALGEPVVLKNEGDVPLEFRVLAVTENPLVPPWVQSSAKQGTRYVGIELELRAPVTNEGKVSGFLHPALADDLGVPHEMVYSDLDYLFPVVHQGETMSVSVVFQLRSERTPARFIVSFNGPDMAAWALGRGEPDGLPAEEDSVKSPGDGLLDEVPDPIENIRRLAQLRDEGILSEEEFQAKKAELLRRV